MCLVKTIYGVFTIFYLFVNLSLGQTAISMQFLVACVVVFMCFLFADVSSIMDPNFSVAALLTRIRDADDYYATDLLSGWGYQGNCGFNQESLKQLASLEGKGVWFNKVDSKEASKTPHPWSDYLMASEKFMRGEFANPISTDLQHFHINEAPRSFYAIAAEAFKRGIFKMEATKITFNLYAPPSKSKKARRSLLPPTSSIVNKSAKVGSVLPPPSSISPAPSSNLPLPAPAGLAPGKLGAVITPSPSSNLPLPASAGLAPGKLGAVAGGSVATPSTSQPSSGPPQSMPPPKSLADKVKDKLARHKKEKADKAARQYKRMIENSPPIIPGSKILLAPLSSQEVVVQTSAPVCPAASVSVPSQLAPAQSVSTSSTQSSSWFPTSLVSSPSLATVSSTVVSSGGKLVLSAKNGNLKGAGVPASRPPATSTPSHSRKPIEEKEGCSISADEIRKVLKLPVSSSPSSLVPSSSSSSVLASASLDDSGVADVGPSPLKGSSAVVDSNGLLEREINKEMDDNYGPVNVETNQRDHAYPPVFDKMGNLVKSLKCDIKELQEKNVNLHREVEGLASRTKMLDDHLVKKVVAEVSKSFCHELDVKTAWLERQFQEEGKNTCRHISELGKKFENAVSSVREEFGEAIDLLVDEVNQQPGVAPAPVEGDLREKINSKRSSSPTPLPCQSKSVRLQHPFEEPAPVSVTVCGATLFSTQSRPVQSQAGMGLLPMGQAPFSPTQVVCCALDSFSLSYDDLLLV